jgi:16S rRNA (guanine1207-N2)-methyltransferase
MGNHYFSNNPDLTSRPKEITYRYENTSFVFATDAGVFSKSDIDTGSTLLLENFKMIHPQGRVIDVGCGYGILGIAIAKTYPESQVLMIDINERAVALTKENLIRNNVLNAKCIASDLYQFVEGQFDVIVSNPPIRAGKSVVYKIFSEGYERLKEGGFLMIVIRKKQGAPSAEKKLFEIFGNVETTDRKKGYYILKSEKKAR